VQRRIPIFLLSTAGAVAVAIIAVACSSPDATNNPFPTRDLDAGKKGKDSGSRPPTNPAEEDPPLPDGGVPPGAVYGHTADALYLFEPIGKTLTKKGDFACLEGSDRMLDIAVDRDGVMFGTSDHGLLSINPTNANCTYVKKEAAYPNSLSFVPMGTADATQEALVGYQFDGNAAATNYVQINTATGAITPLGNLNDGALPGAIKYKSSGDLIALIRNGNKAYLTVKTIDPDAGTGTDFLAEVNPSNGRLVAIIGDIKKPNLYGFGFWAGTGYGFSGTGELLEIDMTTAKSKTLLTLTEDGGVRAWFGAGVKTFAPTAPTTTQ
jgi:hypothetical protein